MRKVALVTGATRGIGRSIALALGKAGFSVVATGRTLEEGQGRQDCMGSVPVPGSLASTVQDIEAAGGEALGVRLDLLDRGSIDAAVTTVLERWGRVDVLVNNGIYQGPAIMQPLMTVDMAGAEEAVLGNFVNQFHLSREVLKPMIAQGGGRMIFVSTLSSAIPAHAGAGLFYIAPKAAFNRLPDFINLEHGKDGISAFLIEPQFTLTDTLKAALGEDVAASAFGGHPHDPQETARTVVWLAGHADAPAHAGPDMINAPAFFAERGISPPA